MSYDKITFNDLFDFNDDSQIEKAQAAIKRLMDVYSGFQKDIAADNAAAAKSNQALARSLTGLEKKLQAVNIASAEGQKQAAAYAQQVSVEVKAINELRLGQEKLQKQIKELEGTNRRLQSAYDKLTVAKQKAAKASGAAAGSIKHLKEQAEELRKKYEALGPATDKAIKDAHINRMNRLGRAINQATEAMALARRGALGAASSYAGLVQENARLIRQLREMPNAFDRVTGAINKQNKAAVDLQRQINQNSIALKRMDGQMGMNQRNVGDYGMVANGIKQFGLALAGQFAGVMALAEATRIAFTANLELSDAMAAVRKTVGLTQPEVEGLAESFKQIDTRTSLNGLFEIARVGGQFNVAQEDIEAFTVAADKAAVALGDEFKGGVEEVATELYTLRGLFDETRQLSPADAMLAVGSAINTLGAQGAATGPVIAEFAKRLGQLGERAPDIAEALGMGAALQELGFSAEIAAGGYTNAIIQMNVHAPKFAKHLKVTTEQFREMLKNDPNETILKYAESISGMENGVDVMRQMGVMSQESIKVIESLGDRIDFVREKLEVSNTAFSEASSIHKEFAIVNDTLAASWEKLKRVIVESVTSGAIGGFIKAAIDDVRGFIGVFQQAESQVVRTAEATIRSAAATADRSKDLHELAKAYDVARVAQGDYAKETEEMQDILAEIRTKHGEHLVSINKETGALELNIEALEKQKKAYQDAATAAGEKAKKASDAIVEEEAALRAALKVKQRELRVAQEVTDEARARIPLMDKLDFTNKEYDKARAVSNKLREEEKLLEEQLNSLLVTKKVLIEDVMKSMSAAQVLGWEKLSSLEMPNTKEGVTDEVIDEEAAKKQADELKALAEAAREAEHQLRMVKLETQLMHEEWRGENIPIDDWSANVDSFTRVWQAQTNIAKEKAAEALRHNKAGANGVAKINADLAKDLDEINKEYNDKYLAYINKRDEWEQGFADRQKKRDEERIKSGLEAAKKHAENSIEWGNRESERQKGLADLRKQYELEVMDATFNLGAEMVAAYYGLQQQYADLHLDHLNFNRQKELDAAGDNEEAKAEIEERYRKQELQMRQRQAKLAKQEALFNIAINTAMAVMRVLSSTTYEDLGVKAGLLTGLVIATGAVQAGAVMASPIPQYYKGTTSSKEGIAEIAERGPELLEKDGRFTLAQHRQFAYLKKGTKVYTADQTKTILSRSNELSMRAGGNAYMNSLEAASGALITVKTDSDKVAERLVAETRSGYNKMAKAIARQPRVSVNIGPDGVTTSGRNGQQWNTYENSKYRR